jgi:S1-C subfamily serine protease
MNRTYVAALALAAAIVLVIGTLLRPRLRPPGAAVPAPPSEAAALQQLSQAAQLRHMSEFLSERIGAVAPFVLYVDTLDAAAVRWRGDGTVVSTTPAYPIVALRTPSSDSLPSPELGDADSTRHDWMLIVTRRRGGGILSATILSGGRLVVQCGRHTLKEYNVSPELRAEFAGGGLFGLDGRLLGIVARCGGRQAALPTSEVRRLLADTASGDRLRDVFGLGLSALDERARDYFHSDSGLLVVSIRRASAADVGNVRPGDVILAVGGVSVARGASAELVRRVASADSLTILRQRGRAVASISLTAGVARAAQRGANLGIEMISAPARGVAILAVRAGSAAAAAGLRAGDRLIRIGNTSVKSSEAAQRLLTTVIGQPTFIVFERDSVEHGVFVPQ